MLDLCRGLKFELELGRISERWQRFNSKHIIHIIARIVVPCPTTDRFEIVRGVVLHIVADRNTD